MLMTFTPEAVSHDTMPDSSPHKSLLERENTLPVVLHADHRPTLALCFRHQRIRESADLRVQQSARGPVRILPLLVVVIDEHLQPRAGACTGPLQHLAVAG